MPRTVNVPRARRTGDEPAPSTGELAVIERIRRQATTAPAAGALRLGIGDDAAILRLPRGHEIVLTTDLSLEGRHFRRAWHPASSIGHRTLARGLSDLAAMGAQPLAAFLSLALPRRLARSLPARDAKWLDGFLAGLLALAAESGCPLAGGDTAESPRGEVLADIVLLGSAPAGKALRRSTARAGDGLFVTGSLGGAAAELEELAARPARFRRAVAAGDHPHLFPRPRVSVGRALLRRRLATACIDLSDGLSTDLTHLCQASHLAAEIDAAALPLHPLAAAFARERALQLALHGGEDYELLFAAAPRQAVPRSIAGVPVTRIGCLTPARRHQPTLTLLQQDRRTPVEPGGWEHLR